MGTEQQYPYPLMTGGCGESETLVYSATGQKTAAIKGYGRAAELLPSGIRPRFAEKLRAAGVEFPADLFNRRAA